jgi:hypothetical protein
MDAPPTPDQKELLRQARRAGLMQIWAKGSRRLSADERAEIADLIGEEQKPAGFALEPGAPLPAKLRNYYRFTYAEYATGENGAPNFRNAKDGRTVKRWVSCGRNSTPHDLPPLDDPPAMAAWFRRAFPKEPVPAALLDYERAAPTNPRPAHEPPRAMPDAPAAGAASMTAIDFAAIDPEADAAVRRAAIIEEANGRRVQEASALGNSDDYRRWFPIWQESANLLRQLAKEDREARKASGALLDRARVLAELSQLLEALRIMRETMEAKIVSELSRDESKRIRRIVRLLEAPLRAAIAKVRAAESAIFQNLESLTSPAAAQAAFALDVAA